MTIFHRLIRLSSPKLNNIIIFGVVVLYIAAVLFAIPTQSKSVVSRLCVARLWFLSLGVSLAFGTIIMKMFRVYIIFSNPTPKRKKVSLITLYI
jgi:gamma-aminobutyric acid type B receptor